MSNAFLVHIYGPSFRCIVNPILLSFGQSFLATVYAAVVDDDNGRVAMNSCADDLNVLQGLYTTTKCLHSRCWEAW